MCMSEQRGAGQICQLPFIRESVDSALHARRANKQTNSLFACLSVCCELRLRGRVCLIKYSQTVYKHLAESKQIASLNRPSLCRLRTAVSHARPYQVQQQQLQDGACLDCVPLRGNFLRQFLQPRRRDNQPKYNVPPMPYPFQGLNHFLSVSGKYALRENLEFIVTFLGAGNCKCHNSRTGKYHAKFLHSGPSYMSVELENGQYTVRM